MDALTGTVQPVHGERLGLQLERLPLIEEPMTGLHSMIAAAMKSHPDAVIRLAEVPGLGVDSAQPIIAEVGAQASTFASAAELTSGVGTCPGKDESAEQNHSSRSAKGNKYLRRVLNQAAHAAVAKKRQSLPSRVPASIAPPRLSVCHLGGCTSALSSRLEDPASRSAVYPARHRSRSSRKEETCADAGASTSQAWL